MSRKLIMTAKYIRYFGCLVVIIVTIAVCFEMLLYYVRVLRDTAMANGLQYNSDGIANQKWELAAVIASMMMMMMMMVVVMVVCFFVWYDNPNVHNLCKHPLARSCPPSSRFILILSSHLQLSSTICILSWGSLTEKQLAFCLFIVFLKTVIKNST
jgi:hypothetical protein